MRHPFVAGLLTALAAALAADGGEPRPGAGAVEYFERKVRPIRVERCQSCHGEKKRRGKVRLDSRAGLLKGGDTGPAVVAGEPEKSLLVKAIGYGDQARMPPRSKL